MKKEYSKPIVVKMDIVKETKGGTHPNMNETNGSTESNRQRVS